MLTEKHSRTGAVTHFVDGKLLDPVPALAVAQYPKENRAYLFHCDANWEVIQDDLLDSIDEAIEDALWQYEGLEKSDFVAV